MTVSTEINQAGYTGNGVTTVFPFTFRILQAGDLTVTVIAPDDQETVLILGTGYTISGAGGYSGGTVTLPQPLPVSYQIVLKRDMEIVQETDLRNQGTFLAEVHENAFDYLTMLIQQVFSSFNLALRKPTFLSRFYDAQQNKISNLGDPSGPQEAVNVRTMRSYVEQMIAGVVGGYGWFIQNFTGAVNRTFQDKMRDTISVKDFGAVGDGVTDDTQAIQNAINAAGMNGILLVPNLLQGEPSRYKVTTITNPYGVKFIGDGAIFYYDTNGGANQINLNGDNINLHLGQEYLFRAYNRMRNRGVMEIHLFGDSTVAGNNGETTDFKIVNVIGRAFKSSGYPMVSINNWGVGGSNVTQMDAVSHLSSTSDLFIIKYGINDAGLGGGLENARLAAFESSLRAKILQIRQHQYGAMAQLSIILMMPNSTNDLLLLGRNSFWYEQLRSIYVRAARDFSCALFDTYNAMPISSGLAGNAMDDPFSNGIAIHPLDSAMTWIYAKVIDTFFNRTVISNYAQNLFINEPAVTGTPSSGAALTSYNYGISQYRALGAGSLATWPVDGTVITWRSVDDAGIQMLYPFSDRTRMIVRVWIPQTSSWSVFTGQSVNLSSAGGWTTNFGTPNYRMDISGKVTIQASLGGGTVAVGTTILTGLPNNLYPQDDGYYPVVNNDGTIGVVGLNAAGNIYIVSNIKAGGVKINFSYWPATL